MKTYTLYWLTGNTEVVKGDSIQEAFSRAGYGSGALQGLDFYEENSNEDEWVFDAENNRWKNKKYLVLKTK